MDRAVIGLFQYVDNLLDAAHRLKNAGYNITIFSPIPIGHEIEESLGERPNFIKWFALAGCLSGMFFGAMLTLGTAAMYVLPRGGRPLFSITPTFLMAYETTILFGVIMTLLGFLLFTRLPSWKTKPYVQAVNIDSFGLMVDNIGKNKRAEVEEIMKQFGASDVVDKFDE